MVKNMMVDPVVIMSCSIEVAIKYNVSLVSFRGDIVLVQ